ncbi:MAG: N-acetylmuramoyl-L-alanine amidase, partial [Chthoniobacterales bacterium]
MQFVRISLALLALALAAHAQKLTPLAQRPDWSTLDKFQGTITEEEFTRLLTQVYAPRGAWQGAFAIADNHVTVHTGAGQPPFTLNFAPDAAGTKPVPRYWQPRGSLRGLRIALDPGHLGGEWARMEERWFQIGNNKPVTEGDMVLDVAKLLKSELERRGASVSLTRSSSKPATNVRPGQLRPQAAASLRDQGRSVNPASLKSESERLFYRTAEIRSRARKVNSQLKPDLVLALHFNAEEWGNPARPTLTEINHLHLLVSGCYSARELEYEDQRYDLMVKLLNRSYDKEVSISRAVAQSMARATGLPPYTYTSDSAINVGGSPYVWARNLLANRLFECPVVYLEPYVMNNREVHDRVQLGDYPGRRNVNGTPRE